MAITVAMRTQVTQLYVSLFGRAPDSEGLGFWVQALNGGMNSAQIAESMYNTAPARTYYPQYATNQEIVATFYQNVLGRPADAEGLAFWTKELAAAPSKGAFFTKLLNNVVNYSGSDADGLKSQALFLNKVAVAQYFAETDGSIENATAAILGITELPASVIAAKAAIDNIGVQTFMLTTSVTIDLPDEPQEIETANEGQTVYVFLETKNVPAGTEYTYAVSGINADDLISGSLTGKVKVDAQGLAVLELGLKPDFLTEGAETVSVGFATPGQGIGTEFTVRDTSIAAPTMGGSRTVVAEENQTSVTTVAAAGNGLTPTYAIIGGADAALFNINATTGVLTFKTAPNFEDTDATSGTNTYELLVSSSVTGSAGTTRTSSQLLNINVTNQNESPTLLTDAGAAITVVEGTTAVAAFTTTDPDAGDTFTYSLSGNDAEDFQISSSGVLSFVTAPDYENPADQNTNNVYNVTVTSTDSGGLTSSKTLTVSIEDKLDQDSLTVNQDLIIGTNESNSISGNTTTYTAGDVIDGNGGNDTLTLVLNENETAYAGQTVTDVENIVIRAIASSGTAVSMSMTDVTGAETIKIEKSTGNVNLEDLQEGVDIVIDDVAGNVSIDYDTQNAPSEQNISMSEFGSAANEAGASDLAIDELVEKLNITDASTGTGFFNSVDVTGAFTELNVTGGAVGTDLIMTVDSSASTLDADFSSNASDGKAIVVNVSVIEAGDADDLQDLTLKTGQNNDVVTVVGDLTANSSVDTGAGSDGLTVGDIDGAVLLGEGNNTLAAGDITGAVSAGAGDDEITAGAISGVITLGEGDNSLDSGAISGTVTAGAGDDEIIAAAISGDITLGEGDNSLDSGSISGSVTAGGGENTIMVNGDITGQIEATDGDNLISAIVIGKPSGLNDTTQITLGNGDNVIITSDEITGSANLTLGDGQNIVLAGLTQGQNGLVFGDAESDIDGDATLTFGDGNNLVVVENDIEGGATLNFGTGNNTVLVGDELQGEANISFQGGNNTVRVLTFNGDDMLDVEETNSIAEAQAAIIAALIDGAEGSGEGNLEDSATVTFGGDGNNILEVSNDLGETGNSRTTVSFGHGDNTVDVGDDVTNGDITFGNGDNELTITDSLDTSDISFGDGANTMLVGDDIDGTTLTFGDGGNSLTISGSSVSDDGNDVNGGSVITFGSGNDSLSVGGVESNNAYIWSTEGPKTVIQMGAGNDTVTLFSADTDDYAIVTSGGSLDGGDGEDDVLNFNAAADTEGGVALIERDDYQKFTITIDKTYAIGDVVTLMVGDNEISYEVQASDFTQGITADEVNANIAAGLHAAADSMIGFDDGDESFEVGVEDNVITFTASNYGPDLTVSVNDKGTLATIQYADVSIKGFETLNLHSVADIEGVYGDVEVDFALVDGVSKAINMVSESEITATDDVPANSGNDAGYAANFYLYGLDRAESLLLSIAADEVTAEGDRQAVKITINDGDAAHAIGDVITVTIGEIEVEYTVTAADLNGADAEIDAKQIARSLELAIGAAATAAGFSFLPSSDNTITLVGTASEDVVFNISTVSADNNLVVPTDTVVTLVSVSAEDDNEADVYIAASIGEDADTDNDTLALAINGRGNFDMDLSTESWGGEDYEHIKLDVKDSFSHFIDFVDNDTDVTFEQDGTLTLTGGAAGESIYLDNVNKATVNASTSAADLTIRMVGVFDASLVVRTGSGDDTLLMQETRNELALVNLDDTINLGGGYNTLVINAQNIYNQTTLIDMEGMDRWYGDGAESHNPEPVADNAYAFAYAFFDANDDYKRAENQLYDQDFTTIRNVQKLVLGTHDQSEDRFVNQTSGEIETNTSSFYLDLGEKAHAAGIQDIVFTDNQDGETVLSVANMYNHPSNAWGPGDLIRVVIGDTEVTYEVHQDDVSSDNQASPYNARIAQKLFEAIDAKFTGSSEVAVGNTITLVDENITITRVGANLNFGNIDDGLVFAEAYKAGDFQKVTLDSRNLEDSVIEFGWAYGEGDEVSVTTYASLTDSDTDRLDILNDTEGANLTVNVRDIDIRDRESVQSFIGSFGFGANDREFDNFQNVPVRDPREEDDNQDDYYTDFVSRVFVQGSEYSEDTINVVTTGEGSLLRINGTNIDAVNVTTVEGEAYSEFVLDVNNVQYENEEGGPQTLTFDASALTDSEGGITLQLATVYEAFDEDGEVGYALNESDFDTEFLGSIIGIGDPSEEVISDFAPISADAYIVSATNQAEVVLDVTATAGNDFIVGGKYGDVIRGELGSDILLGNGGSDTIYAGANDDAESYNVLQGDLVTAENQVVEVAFDNNYDEDDLISVTVNGNTYSYDPAANGGSEAVGDGFDSEGVAVTNDFDDANGALVVNNLIDQINADFEGNSEGELTAALAMDDDEWVLTFTVNGDVAAHIDIDGRQIKASGSTSAELAADFVSQINAASDADTAQDFLIARASLQVGPSDPDSATIVITRALSVSSATQYAGIGSLEVSDIYRNDNGTNLYIVGVIAGDDLEVSATIDNSEGIADHPQVYTVSSSVDMDDDDENGERVFYVVVEGITYTYTPSGDSEGLADIKDALGASNISYTNDSITITGPLDGSDMPLITQAYVADLNGGGPDDDVLYQAFISITDADQAADDQDEPVVTVVQEYHTVHADEQDDLYGGAGQDAFMINKSADSTDIAAALDAVDTIHNLQLGAGGDTVIFNAFIINADPLMNIQVMAGNDNPYDAAHFYPLSLAGDVGMNYHSYFDDSTNALEINNVVNFGAVEAMNANALTLAAAVNGLFAENNVFEVSGSAATNSAGLFSYGGETYLIAVGDDASATFGADDYIVKLMGQTGVLSIDNVAEQVG